MSWISKLCITTFRKRSSLLAKGGSGIRHMRTVRVQRENLTDKTSPGSSTLFTKPSKLLTSPSYPVSPLLILRLSVSDSGKSPFSTLHCIPPGSPGVELGLEYKIGELSKRRRLTSGSLPKKKAKARTFPKLLLLSLLWVQSHPLFQPSHSAQSQYFQNSFYSAGQSLTGGFSLCGLHFFSNFYFILASCKWKLVIVMRWYSIHYCSYSSKWIITSTEPSNRFHPFTKFE